MQNRKQFQRNREENYNPANSSNPLYRRLTRLFSGPITVHRAQTQRRFRSREFDKFDFKSVMGLKFRKSEYDPLVAIKSEFVQNQARAERYIDFDQMEYMPEISTALDIYADEMTTNSELEDILTVKSHNDEIKFILETLFYDVLGIESNLFGWCRSTCKYGEHFRYLDIHEDRGVVGTIALPTQEIERMEGLDESNPNYIQFQWNTKEMTFEYWQVCHFRNLGNDRYTPYGTSVLDAARRPWRQLILIEDAMMAYRIVRSPERRVFYVDIGGLAPEDVEQFMLQTEATIKKNHIVDESTGRVDQRYNPLSVEEDIYIPVRGKETATRVETLKGGQYTGDIDDVKYIQQKVLAALKVPQSYLINNENSSEDKGSLVQKDIHFSRTILRLQRSILDGLYKMARIHLFTLGFRGKDLFNFSLSLSNPSRIAEMQELERWRTKFDVAGAASEGYFSTNWIYKNILNLSDDEIVKERRNMISDAKFAAKMASIEEDGEADMGGGGAPPDLGEPPDMGGDIGGGEDLGEPPPAEAEDDILLAAPPKRDDERPMDRSKGKKYEPVKHDKRNMGARKDSYRAKSSSNIKTSLRSDLNPVKNNLVNGIFERNIVLEGIETNNSSKNFIEKMNRELLRELEDSED